MAKPDEQTFLDYYAVLEVEPAASDEEIKRAYRNLAKRYHPDLSMDPEATERFLQIQQAYEVLSDPGRRVGFDLLLKRRQEPGEPAVGDVERPVRAQSFSLSRPYLLVNLRDVGSAEFQFRGVDYALSARQVRVLRERGALRGKTAEHGDYLLCYCSLCHALFGGIQEHTERGKQPAPQELFPHCPHCQQSAWRPVGYIEPHSGPLPGDLSVHLSSSWKSGVSRLPQTHASARTLRLLLVGALVVLLILVSALVGITYENGQQVSINRTLMVTQTVAAVRAQATQLIAASRASATAGARASATASVQASAAATAEAGATAQAQASATTIASAFPFSNQLVLNDTLTTPGADWTQNEDCGFVGGSYQATLDSSIQVGLMCAEQQRVSGSFSYEVHIASLQGANDSMAGIALGIPVPAGLTGYMFVINQSGDYGYYLCGSNCTLLKQSTFHVPAIFPLSVGVTLNVTGMGAVLTFYLNRQQIASYTTSYGAVYQNDGVGVAVYSASGSASAAFTSAQVWELPD